MLKVTPTDLPEVLLLEPRVFGDDRGFFLESYNRRVLAEQAGIDVEFVQDNHSRSGRNVLRGIHYQLTRPQGKLVRAVSGVVRDIVVDLRRSSPRFGRWVAVDLSAENKRMLWVPPGFGHGFCVLSDVSDFLYKTTDYWVPSDERCVHWADPELSIDWGLTGEPKVSAKDAVGTPLRDAEVYA